MSVFSPQEIRNYRDQVAQGYDSLATDIVGCRDRFTENQLLNWSNLISRWKKFVEEWGWSDEYLVMATGSADTIDQFAADLRNWRQTFQITCGRAPTSGDVVIPSEEELEDIQRTVEGIGSNLIWPIALGLGGLAAIMLLRK